MLLLIYLVGIPVCPLLAVWTHSVQQTRPDRAELVGLAIGSVAWPIIIPYAVWRYFHRKGRS